MELALKGKKVLITGASEGIGAATAAGFACEGANLVLVSRSAETLEAVARQLRRDYSVQVDTSATDLSDGSNVVQLARRFDTIDVLVNNAGAVPSGSLFEIDEQRWREGWDSKVFAYINMCRAFYPQLKHQGGGVIVNVLGNGSRVKRPGYICGGMANAALDFFTETLGARSADDNIRIVGISPGPVDTPRYRRIAAARRSQDPEQVSEMPYAFGRIAAPEEVASLVVLAASDRFSYVSGTIVVMDGGMSVGTRQ